jgi:DNA-directed RNA polymerase subunit F
MNPKIEEELPISLYELKKEMTKIKKRDEVLSLRNTKTDEYLNSFATMKQKDADDLDSELTALNVPRLKDMHVKKIVDTVPESVDELKVILQGYSLTITKENMEKIVELVKKHKA